ncbi:hypothetical protein [Methylophaga sp.]|uniref:hypothetical protein n=1 Tax=Methylophaga sp. TaxID=2024840 RepID=UPI003F6A4A6A
MKRLTQWSALLICLLFWQLSAQAIEQIDIQVGNWSTKQLAAEGFDLDLNLTSAGLSFIATADELLFPPPFNEINTVKLSCGKAEWLSGQFNCQSGRLSFNHMQLGQQNLAFSLSAEPDNSSYLLHLNGLSIAGATITASGDIDKAGWQFEFDAKAIQLKALQPWLLLLLDEAQLASLSAWDYAGEVNLKAELTGQQEKLEKLAISWIVTALNFSNQTGSQVAEQLKGQGKVSAVSKDDGWQWQTEINFQGGQSYIDPVFIDFKAYPTKLDARGYATSDLSLIDVPEITLEQAALLSAKLNLTLQDKNLTKLNITAKSTDFKTLYPNWLQPFSLGTPIDKLEPRGQLQAIFHLKEDNYRFELDLDDVSIVDQNQLFSISGLNGVLGWSTSEDVIETKLHWQQAQVYAIQLGETTIEAESKNNGFSLTQDVELPVFDGRLLINAFSLQQQADSQLNWTFDGLLTPVSMEALSDALQWPKLHGKLSGVIPNVSYSNEQLKIDGALQMKVFDGTTVIRDLRMTSPLGALPQLYANIDITNLDLDLLTKTFDFGRITGKLEGYVHELRLSNWQPVQFKASLTTPKENPGKRRISQKAVDNLTQIGGGAGMISRSFLRFFDDFAYQKLGLNCTLINEVCDMSGIEEAEQGYYIVKGGGGLPPWINVVGYTRQVDWSELIERLKAVQNSSGPVIQ